MMFTSRLPWNPAQNLERLHRDLQTLFEDVATSSASAKASFVPRLDYVELADRYEVSIELPGVPQEKVEIDLDQDELRIRGEKHRATHDDKVVSGRFESPYGVFERVLRFPVALSHDQVTANFVDGVLTVVLPKAPTPAGTRIAITSQRPVAVPTVMEGTQSNALPAGCSSNECCS